MRTIFKTLISIGIALMLAFGGLFYVTSLKKYEAAGIKNGPWVTTLEAGSGKASIYQSARAARYGLWALDKSEVVYYIAIIDSDGKTLDYNYDYMIKGGKLPARWWSLTTYKDLYFIPNEMDRYSYSSTNIDYNGDGTWTIKLSAEEHNGNWLPLGDEEPQRGDKKGRIYLTLRLYNPDPEVIEHPDKIELPQITRE